MQHPMLLQGNAKMNFYNVSVYLNEIRKRNFNQVIIAHLNVNSYANKFDAIKTIIKNNLDIIIFSETKLDDSYPTSQFIIDGYSKPFRLDRDSNGSGILLYLKEDIPCKQLINHTFCEGIEGIFIEIKFRKSKWLLFGTYHPPKQNDQLYFDNVSKALYSGKYDNILLAGDFYANESNTIMQDFMELFNLKNLVKENTCFKSITNPTCIDLFFTNNIYSFHHIDVVATGISDFHKMILTIY